MINFLSSTNTRIVSHIWRNIVAACILFVCVGGAGFYMIRDTYVEQLSDDMLEPVKMVMQEKIYSYEDIGGDIAFDYTPVVIPQLRSDVDILPHTSFSAVGILVKDRESNMMLYQKEPYEEHQLASITKLMSAIVLLEHDMKWDMTAQVISDNVVDTHMYAGDTYTLDELWRGALIGSSNKAILTLVDATGWTRESFVARMNERAQELGMRDTHFTDPTGLDAGNISTPSDIILLLREALLYDDISIILSESELTLYSYEREKEHHMWNTNWILLDWITHDFELIGGKTGYIPSSGYNFAMSVSDGDNHIIDVIILGADSHEARFTEARDIAQWVFEHYVWK